MNNTTASLPLIEDGVGYQCTNYRDHYPTSYYMFHHPPPEYYPLLGVGFAFFLSTSVLLVFEIKKHGQYLNDVYFKLSARVIMILTAFWVFAFTNFLGIIFVRGDIFLHFVSNVFETACLLAFYDCILLHCRALGEVFNGTSFISLKVPPCCCCLFCLPMIRTTEENLKWLRYAIIQQIFLQTLVEFIRVLTVFDCRFDPKSVQVMVFDTLVLLSFFFAMWALFVVVKGRKIELEKFKYIQKFAMFKLMIIVQKFLYKFLSFFADKGYIPSYHGIDSKFRCATWVNFVTVVVSTILLLVVRRFFTIEDYKVVMDQKQKEQYAIDSTDYGSVNHEHHEI